MAIKAEKSFSLKDDLFNSETVGELSSAIARVDGGFSATKFQRRVLKAFPQLELKQRINWMVEVLGDQLNQNYGQALQVLTAALPAPLDPTLKDDDFGRFIWVVPSEFAARYGCTESSLEESLAFLECCTQRFSAESAIRPFLSQFPAQTMAKVTQWSKHENYHVRRLASEGIRPLLPWAEKVVMPTSEVLSVLSALYQDPTRYVTRSVANNLNDLTKFDPELVLGTLKKWHKKKGNKIELNWMTRHALRTLISRDHPDALSLLGYSPDARVDLKVSDFTDSVKVGDSLKMTLTINSTQGENLLLSLRVHFLKANGQLNPKTFRLKDISMKPGETVVITKKLPIRPATTRTLYPGKHQADIVINGRTCWQQPFELIA